MHTSSIFSSLLNPPRIQAELQAQRDGKYIQVGNLVRCTPEVSLIDPLYIVYIPRALVGQAR